MKKTKRRWIRLAPLLVLLVYTATYVEARSSNAIFFGEYATTGRFGGPPRYSALPGRSDALDRRVLAMLQPAIAVEKYFRERLVDESYERDLAVRMDTFVLQMLDRVRLAEEADADGRRVNDPR